MTAVKTTAVTVRAFADPALPQGAKRRVLACGRGVTVVAAADGLSHMD